MKLPYSGRLRLQLHNALKIIVLENNQRENIIELMELLTFLLRKGVFTYAFFEQELKFFTSLPEKEENQQLLLSQVSRL